MAVDKNPHHRAVPESYESDTFIQREDSRETQKRASRGPQHAAFSDCREAQFCLAWGGEAMLEEVKSGPEEQTQLQPDLYHFTYGEMSRSFRAVQ